ncbi:14-3-3 protein [Aaosphaeria arxii CBS 175.79]|uniref:14-3-3 protein n=1 Tax=Aaosphaeria arxii CBS 175.79 TaxID=1450172 RepID=A0A6A5Y0T6_9PLEO|nr:14-3-3 protein [Aaosphaeria arxii CBS 175.79]KAF2018697.1 14-3-3 protein [Aaosphaeria arxii CBS 175.79]
MASLDFDQKFLGRVAKQTADSNALLSSSLYQILGLSVLLSKRLIKARKLRKLDTSRDTPSLAAYQHILWLSREGLSILELYVLPYAQDNQQGPECRVLSVKLRASFYHIFCLFHNQPPVTIRNLSSNDPRGAMPPFPSNEREGNGQLRRHDGPPGLSPSSKRTGKQPTLREPIDSITSETSFLTNPYAAGGPVGTPSPGPIHAPPGLNPIPIPQPSSFILPPLNFIPLATGYFETATSYAQNCLPGSHPLRLSVALEHSAFVWDCLHDHEASRRIARRAIKDVYRAQEEMEDNEFEDAAELVGVLGRMMKRKSFEGTPRIPSASSPAPAPTGSGIAHNQQGHGGPLTPTSTQQHTGSPQRTRRAADGPPIPNSPAQSHTKQRSRSNSNASKPSPRTNLNIVESMEHTPRGESRRQTGGSQGTTPRMTGGGSQDTTPRARHTSVESGASSTPRAPQGAGGRSPATPSTVRTIQHQPPEHTTPVLANSAPVSPSTAAIFASDAVRASPTLRRSPPLGSSPRAPPSQDTRYARQEPG